MKRKTGALSRKRARFYNISKIANGRIFHTQDGVAYQKLANGQIIKVKEERLVRKNVHSNPTVLQTEI